MFPRQLELKETTEDFIRMDCTNINHMEIKKALKGLIYCLSILYVQHPPRAHTHTRFDVSTAIQKRNALRWWPTPAIAKHHVFVIRLRV